MNKQLLLEKVLEDIIKDSKQTDPQRIEKAETLISTFQEVDKWGIFHFLTTSETTPGLEHKQEIYWPSIHQFKELYQSGGHITLEDFINLIENNDIKVTCFPRGTRVLMEDGIYRNIEDINVGDKVITHSGVAKKVTKTYKNKYSGDIVSLNYNNHTICVTPDHPFLTIPHYKGKTKGTFNWTLAKDIRPYKDMLTSPKIKGNNSLDYSEELMFAFGLYLSEGNVHWYRYKNISYPNQVEINLNSNEEKIYEKLKLCIEKLYGNCISRFERKRHTMQIIISSKQFAQFCYDNCGERAENKYIKFNPLNLSYKARIALFLGMVVGDGCLQSGRGLYFKSTSRPLVEQCWSIGLSIGLLGSGTFGLETNFGKLKTKEKTVYHIVRFRSSHISKFLDSLRPMMNEFYVSCSRKENDIDLDYFLYSTVSIDCVLYDGYVYNIEVEDDNSYVVDGVIVHNCDDKSFLYWRMDV